MNNWQHFFNNPVDLSEHLKKPYFRFDNRDKEVTTISFDEKANLVWSGDSYGCISSYDPNFQLYTRYRGHIGGSSVKDILSHRDGILSISEDSLHFANRRGVTKLNLTSIDIAAFSELNTMCYAPHSLQNNIYCGGDNTNWGIASIDLNKGCLDSLLNYSSKAKLLRSNNKILSVGRQTGSVDLIDPTSNRTIKSFNAHSASISGMDLRDNTLVTVGKSKRFYNLYADPFVNVYDLRTMRQLPPVSFSKGTTMGSGGADFVQLHPLLPTVMIVGSSSGSFDFIDLSNPTLRTQYVHPCQSIKEFSLSPNGDVLGILEADNHLDTWRRSSNNMGMFTNTPEMLAYPDYFNDIKSESPISIDDETYPLSSVGMPYYLDKLLSAWPHVVFKSEGTIPQLSGKPPLPSSGRLKSNTAVISSQNEKLSTQEFPLLRYDRTKYGMRNTVPDYVCLRDLRKQITTGLETSDIQMYAATNKYEVPPAYSRLPLTTGRFGTDNFDFTPFNNTEYSGLDPDVDNHYTNAIIQLYRFIPEVFNFVVGCLKDENFETALLTDLGYLFDMMNRSNGKICSSTNLQTSLKSLTDKRYLDNNVPQEHLEEYLESLCIGENIEGFSSSESIKRNMPQKFNRFLLSQLIKEEAQTVNHNITLNQCFGLETEIRTHSACDHYDTSVKLLPSLPIAGINKSVIKQLNKKNNGQNILPYIEYAMKNSIQKNSICPICGKTDIITQENTVKNLPSVLSLELSLLDTELSNIRSSKNWLINEFYGSIIKNKAILRPAASELKGTGHIFKYELNGYVAKITDNNNETRLVTYVRKYDLRENNFKWLMFNDYLVVEISEEEALKMSYPWKTPEIIIYCDAEELRKPFFSVDTYSINYDILYRDYFANGIRDTARSEYKLLTHDEAPKSGSLVAIDAEFVSLQSELCEIDHQGIRSVIRPKRTALARISIIRGEEGDLYGTPFVDDYVVNTNHIEDYLTRYSGILPGDLDPEKSTKRLVKRNVVYRKVWLLMQLGCIFVGHGLNNDFKHININVPRNQIRDTAIYFLQGKRYLSLRYLAYVLLGMNIQEGNHDSIEDAYTALILYKKYLDLKRKAIFEKVLNSVYEEGRAHNFKVPETSKT
ncbi:hypothetical protein SEUBUCD646_0G01790 [Saccharomyces eubayanus]|uniref:Poly(A)-specific ribonuclease n=2 Tax=Saccharomyces TaxID=4930 RepID=A0A6C1E767_SACPS|nr:poly(A)-specific ribonuclease [Saccharomyces pastorianus]CAI1992194.1 hypothetical protein SEUBUCD650_0G01800 [Saccharomyces eubayanus]CAI2016067.1 hypothetical protein SEUBUCD646_0G01790 [Saccharomyces eubayanus]